MMASPLIKVPGTAVALDWTTKPGIQAEIGEDRLLPNVFPALVAYFGNEDIAGSSVSVIPAEQELAVDDIAAIKDRINFLLGDNISAKNLSDTNFSRVSLSGADAGMAMIVPLQGDPLDLTVTKRLLPFAIGNALSNSEAPNDIQLSASQVSGGIAPTFDMTLEAFLANLQDFTSDLLPKDELNEPFNIADLLSESNNQDAFLGTIVFEQSAVLTQASPSAPQLSEGILTLVLPLGDEKLKLTDNPLSARNGQDASLGAIVSGQSAVLIQASPFAPQLSEGSLTLALPLGDEKLKLTGNNILVDTIPKGVENFAKPITEDPPIVSQRTIAPVGVILLPEKDASQTVDPAILRYGGRQAAAPGAPPNTDLEVQTKLGKKQFALAVPSAVVTPQAAIPSSILTQPAMFDFTRHITASPDRVAPPIYNTSALETAAAIASMDISPSGTGAQSQSGNSQMGTGTNSQPGVAQSQALAAVLDIQRQGWTKALVNRAMSMIQSGGTMSFKIMPAHLGLITLKMSEGRRGTDLRIVADVAATASMLRDAKHQISSAFESAGITLGEYSAGTNSHGNKGSTPQNHGKSEINNDLETRLNQDVAEFSDYSSDDRSNINIIL